MDYAFLDDFAYMWGVGTTVGRRTPASVPVPAPSSEPSSASDAGLLRRLGLSPDAVDEWSHIAVDKFCSQYERLATERDRCAALVGALERESAMVDAAQRGVAAHLATLALASTDANADADANADTDAAVCRFKTRVATVNRLVSGLCREARPTRRLIEARFDLEALDAHLAAAHRLVATFRGPLESLAAAVQERSQNDADESALTPSELDECIATLAIRDVDTDTDTEAEADVDAEVEAGGEAVTEVEVDADAEAEEVAKDDDEAEAEVEDEDWPGLAEAEAEVEVERARSPARSWFRRWSPSQE